MKNEKVSAFQHLKHTLRGGFMTKYKGEAASCAPEAGLVAHSLLKPVALALATVLLSAHTAQALLISVNGNDVQVSDLQAGESLQINGTVPGGTVTNNQNNAAPAVGFTGGGTFTIEGSPVNANRVGISSINALPVIDANVANTTINFTGADLTSNNADSIIVGDGGTVSLANSTLANTGGNVFTVNGGGSITHDATTSISATGGAAINKTGAGTLSLSGSGAINGGITVAGGALSLLTSGAAGGAGNAITTTGSTIVYANGIDNATPIIISSINTDLQVNGADSATQSGVISEDAPNRPLEKTGTGTLFLTAANTYTGSTFIAEGTLAVTGTGSLQSQLINLNGGNFQADAGAVVSGASVQINNAASTFDVDGNLSIGTLIGTVGVVDIAAGANLNITSGAPVSDFGGVIQGDGGLTKSGGQQQTLSGANTYTDRTTVSGGTLNVTGSIASTEVVLQNAGILQVDGASLDDNAIVALNNTSQLQLSGNEGIGLLGGTGVGATAAIGANTLTLNGAAGIVSAGFNAAITGTGSVIVNVGDDAQAFSNTGNTFTDLTVNSGTLIGTAVGSLGATSGAVSVTGGTLDLNGLAHNKNSLIQTGGNVDNGTLTLAGGFFGRTGGGGTATINAPWVVTATGGTIANLDATGIDVTNGTNDGVTIVGNGMAPTINNGAGHAIRVNNAGTGNVAVTVGSGGVQATGGDGINIVSNGAVITVDGTGNVQGGNGAGNDGIDITASGPNSLTTVSVNGAIQGDPGVLFNSAAGGSFSLVGVGNVTGVGDEGVRATSIGGNGNILIDRDGNITGDTHGVVATSSNGGAGTGTVIVTAFAGRTITGDNDGNGTGSGVITSTDNALNTVNGDGNISGSQFGIQATSIGDGNILIEGAGTTSASVAANSRTIFANSTGGNGSVTVNRTGLITNTGTGATRGISANTVGTGNIAITNTGGIDIAGAGSAAIFATHLGVGVANVVVNGAGAINSTGTGASSGIVAQNNSTGLVDVDTGAITLAAASTGDGINAASIGGGNVTVDNAGAINGGRNGISASSVLGGDVTVTLGADVGNLDAPDSVGVATGTVNGTNTITGAGNVTGTNFGIAATSLATAAVGGDINITGSGTTSASGVGSRTILAASVAMNGSVTVNRTGLITNTGTGATRGISAQTAGTGNTSITNTGGINIAGTHSNAIHGAHVGAVVGNVVINGAGAINSTGIGISNGIFAINHSAGLVDVDTGAITLAAASSGDGINASSTGGGNVTVDNGGAINGGGRGIVASTTGAGTIVVTTGADIGNTTAPTGNGIETDTVDGITNIVLGGNVNAGNDGINARSTGGVAGFGPSTAGSGGITISGNGNITGGTGAGDDGIDAATTVGDILVTLNGTISGDPGIVMNSTMGGDLVVTGAGDVTGTAAQGILAETTVGDGLIIINRDGDITGSTTGVDARSSNGGTGTGTVTVTAFAGRTITGTSASGVITRTDAGLNTVNGDGNIVGRQFGINAHALGGGAVDIGGAGTTLSTGANSRTITATTAGGNGSVTVNRTGLITNTGIGATMGILTSTVGTGNIAITNTGGINIRGSNSDAIRASHLVADVADIVVNGTGAINSTGNASSDGIDVQNSSSGLIDIDSGAITLRATSTGDGINASSTGGGNVTVDNAGAINGGGRGIVASTTGAGTIAVTTGADIGDTTAPTTEGIETDAVDGITTITLGGNVIAGRDGINARSTGGAAGLNASTVGSGGITITGNGNITGGTDVGDDGIDAATTVGDILVDVNGTITGDPGIVLSSVLGGDLTVAGAGNVTGTMAEGILATTTNGNGNVSINRDGNILGNTTGVDARTSNAAGTGTGTVSVTAFAGRSITGTTAAGVITRTDNGLNVVNGAGAISGAQFGVDAQSRRGAVNVTGTGNTTATGGFAPTTGINARITEADATTAVTVTRIGTIAVNAGNVAGTTSAIGIDAQNAGISATSNVAVVTGAATTVNSSDEAIGIRAVSAATSAAASVNVTTDAALTVTSTNGANTTGAGIETTAAGATTTINLGGALSSTADGIRASSTSGMGGGLGDIAVNNNGHNITADSDNSNTAGQDGIEVDTGSGAINIRLLGAGGVVQGAGNAIDAESTGNGVVNVTNEGTLGVAGAVPRGLVQMMTTNVAGSTFTNTGTWFAQGGTSTIQGNVVNSGTILMQNAGTVDTINVSGNLNNAGGTINMVDGVVGDTVNVAGNYTGGGTVNVDLDLSQANAGPARSDQVNITGASAGNEAVNFSVLAGGGALLIDPIVVVNANAAAGNFTSGPIGSIGAVNYSADVNPVTGNLEVTSTFNPNVIAATLGAAPSAINAANAAFSTSSRIVITNTTQQRQSNEMDYGFWTRLVGGRFNADSVGTVAIGGTPQNFVANTDTSFSGVQTGFDVARFDIDGSGYTAHLGVTGGLLNGSNHGANGGLTFDVPFVGAYASISNENFFFDATLRRDFYETNISLAANGTPFVSAEVEGDGMTAHLASGFFFRHNDLNFSVSGDLFYSQIDLDTIPIVDPFFQSSDTDRIESLIGKATVNVSKAFLYDNNGSAFVPFLQGSVQRDFEETITSTVTDSAGNLVLGSVEKFGTEFSAGGGFSLVDIENDFSVNVRAEARFGERINGYTLTGAIRKNF